VTKFLDLNWQTSQVPEILPAINRVLSSGLYIGGQEVQDFESKFANYTRSNYCQGVGNGLDALKLSMLAAGVGPGDEVIVPSYTFIATWLAVTSIGAKVVPVDVSKKDLSLDAELVKKAITKKTKCIIPVFIFGKVCCDLDEIIAIAEEKNLFLLFDAAQSAGARYIKEINDKDIINSAMAWSFYPGKNLGGIGDAGAVTTNNATVAQNVDLLRNYGSKLKYIHLQRGCNSRMDPIQAAVLNEKLEYLDDWNDQRTIQAKVYDGINNEYVDAMFGSEASEFTNWHLYVIQTSHREQLISYLNDNGVETGIHYPIPPYSQACYEDLNLDPSKFKITTMASKRILSLPIGPHLNVSDVEKTVNLINNFKLESRV
jgi:dTDP-4-amino-4,6-dideoxygalactose transaminase